ncbi:hypothetical protein ACH470_04175 [Streptomyces bottropensis]|uniref:hypothetical protein n=1 Tax=Streptomyces bottropensis TaxID=42235 RepID=UPI00378DE0F7
MMELLVGSLVSGVIQAMASDGWATFRTRIADTLGDTSDERADLSAALDEHHGDVIAGNKHLVRSRLNVMLHSYAAAHPDDAADTFELLVEMLPGTTTVTNDHSTRTGNVSNSNVLGSGAQQATGNGNIQGAGSAYAGARGKARVDNRQDNRQDIRSSVKNGGSGWPAVALIAVLTVAAVFVIMSLIGATGGDEEDGAVKTCGQWLRLPTDEANSVARDIALRLGNQEAARSAWIVQNTQYECNGVEDKLLTDVLAPRTTQ